MPLKFSPPLFHGRTNARTVVHAHNHRGFRNDAGIIRKTFGEVVLILKIYDLERGFARLPASLNFRSDRWSGFTVAEKRDVRMRERYSAKFGEIGADANVSINPNTDVVVSQKAMR